MTDINYFSGTRWLRMLSMASILAAVCSFGTAQAGDTSLDDSAKKVGNNFGELLKGMGQEVKKVGGTLTKSEKKDDKKDKERPDNEPEKNKENPR